MVAINAACTKVGDGVALDDGVDAVDETTIGHCVIGREGRCTAADFCTIHIDDVLCIDAVGRTCEDFCVIGDCACAGKREVVSRLYGGGVAEVIRQVDTHVTVG